MDDLKTVSIRPGYRIPGWSLNDLAVGEFTVEGLKCPIPGCIEVFENNTHGKRYAAEKWKAHVTARELHYFLWYDPEYCYQPPALRFTFIRVDKRHKIAVCHFRREPVQFSKLEEHCQRCKGCLGIDKRYENDLSYQSIRNITKQQLQRDGVAIQGFEACEAYHCCTKIYGSSVQGIHAHMKTGGNHNPTGPVKCMRYRTTKHGYAYVPISDLEYEKLNMVHDNMAVVEHPRKTDWDRIQAGGRSPEIARPSIVPPKIPSATTATASVAATTNTKATVASHPDSSSNHSKSSVNDKYYTVESFRNAVLTQGYELFEGFYKRLIRSCIQKFNGITWNHQADIISKWPRQRLYDDTELSVPGYSFVTDGRNPNTGDPHVLLRVAQSPGVNLFKHGLYSPDVEAYIAQCDDFVQTLMVLVYCSIAHTPSPGEMLRWTYCNERPDVLRSMVVYNGQVQFRGGPKTTRKYLPWVVGEILVRYLQLVRPFELYLGQHLGQLSHYNLSIMQTHVFAGIKSKNSECDLSDAMRTVTSRHLEKAASEHVWKSLLHTIMDRVSDKQWSDHTFSEAWFNSTGINKIRLQDVPQLGSNAVLH